MVPSLTPVKGHETLYAKIIFSDLQPQSAKRLQVPLWNCSSINPKATLSYYITKNKKIIRLLFNIETFVLCVLLMKVHDRKSIKYLIT